MLKHAQKPVDQEQSEKELSEKRNKVLKIMMLPHSTFWEVVIMTTIIIEINVVIVNITYRGFEEIQYTHVVQIICEIFFIADIISIILHRHFSVHKNDVCERRLPTTMVVLCFISILPIYNIYIHYIGGKRSEELFYIITLKALVRILRVILFFKIKRHEAGVDQFKIIFFHNFYILMFYGTASTCIFYRMGCYKCNVRNWMIHLDDYVYDNSSLVDSYVIPYTYIGGLLAGNYSGSLLGSTFSENFLVVCTVVVGMVIKLMIFQSQLIERYINVHRKQRLFNSRLNSIFHFVDTHNFDKDLQAEVREFYNVLWHKREAILNMPPCFNLLPLSLQKEVTLDLFWDALKHSHLFKNVDITFKRDLSLLMKSEFLLAGDFLYNTDELKTKLIYITSGIVQILSDEDDQSPVVSFSSGTILSELACLMGTRSECMIRCATYCEFKTLSLPVLFRKLLNYRHRSVVLHEKLQERLTEAKKFNSYKNVDSINVGYLSKPLTRLKNEWKTMHKKYMFHKEAIVSRSHTSKYLDLLVMSDEMELKVEVICLTSKFPFILDPDSSFRAFCNVFCFAAVVLQCLIIPYCAAFHRSMHSEIRKFCMALDLIYVFDIAIQTTTAIKENDRLITNFGAILQGRFREFKFQIDLLATVPYDYIGLITGCSPHTFVLLKMPRIFKVYRAVSYIQKFEKRLFTNPTYIILYKYIILISIILYFSMCILYMKACFTATCDEYSWYSYNRRLDIWSERNYEIVTALRSLYTVIALIIGAGSGDSTPYTATDCLFMFILKCIGYYLMKFCTAEIISSKYWSVHHEIRHKILINSILNYARMHKFSQDIVHRIEHTLRFRWEFNKNLTYNSSFNVFEDTPKNLYTRLANHLITSSLEACPLFQMWDEELLRLITIHCKVIAYPPKSVIIASNSICTHIYIIQKGYCELESNVPGDIERCTNKKIYKTGECFPFVEVLHEIPTFVCVSSVTTVEVIAVPYQKLLNCFKLDLFRYSILKRVLHHHYADNESLFARKNKLTYSNMISNKYENMFVYDKPAMVSCNKRIHIASPLARFFTGSFHPNGTFILLVEFCRCVLAIIQFIIAVFYINIFFNYRYILDIINTILDITCWIYIYIRMRLNYYHENGILVTDKPSMMRQYMRSTFYLDVYSSFPFKHLGIGLLFSSTNRIIDVFLLLISRPLQLYKVFQFITYLTKTSKLSEMWIYRIKFFIFFMAVILISANLLEIYICNLINDELVCIQTIWDIKLEAEITYRVIIVYCVYVVTEYFTLFQSNIFTRPTNSQLVFIISLLILFMIIQWTVVSSLTSSGLHGSYIFTQLQNDRRNFKKFAKEESMNEGIADMLLKSDEYLAGNMETFTMELANSRFPPQLTEDILYYMYKKTLTNMVLFTGASESFLKFFSSKLTRVHFKKDAIIIRRNDVQRKLYIVKKGKVDLMVANSKLATLGIGGMFGCFTKSGYIRQTVEVKATLHTELLTLNNSDLWWYVVKCPWIKNRLEKFMLTNPEYVPPMKSLNEDDDSAKSEFKPNLSKKKHVEKYSILVNAIFKGRTLEMIESLLNVHLSSISAIYTLILMLISLKKIPSLIFFVIFYAMDCIFMIKIFFGFSLSYVDENSGLVIEDYKMIIKRYLKTNFCLDFFTVLPPELIFNHFFPGQNIYILSMSNRTLRIIFLVIYYHQFTVKNKVTHALRWAHLIYLTIFYSQLCAIIWSYVACKDHFCQHRTSLSKSENVYYNANTTAHSTLMVYKYVFNVFAGCGIGAFSPKKIPELVVSSCMFLSAIYMSCTIIASCTIIQIIDNFSIGQYDYNITEIKKYLLNQRLSPAIFKRVWKYYLALWKFQNGEHLPSLITNAAGYLKQDAMKDIYGHHLMNHYLFRNTHVDFMRQILAHMKRCIYPYGYTIVEKGDIDGCMYFIHSGTVAVVEKLDLWHNELNRLQKNDSFGEKQGLYRSGHDHSYVTVSTVADILILNKDDWGYLLKFFPATVEEIKARVAERFDLDDF